MERFLIEFVRAKDDRHFAWVPWGLSVAQLTSIAVAVIGIVVIARLSPLPEVSAGPWLSQGAAAGSPGKSPT